MVMFKEFNILNAFTLEASFFGTEPPENDDYEEEFEDEQIERPPDIGDILNQDENTDITEVDGEEKKQGELIDTESKSENSKTVTEEEKIANEKLLLLQTPAGQKPNDNSKKSPQKGEQKPQILFNPKNL